MAGTPKKGKWRKRFLIWGILEIFIYFCMHPDEVGIPFIRSICEWIHTFFKENILPTGSLVDTPLQIFVGQLMEEFDTPLVDLIILLGGIVIFFGFLVALLVTVFGWIGKKIKQRPKKEKTEKERTDSSESPTWREKRAKKKEDTLTAEDAEEGLIGNLAEIRRSEPIELPAQKKKSGGIKRKMESKMGNVEILSFPQKVKAMILLYRLKRRGKKNILATDGIYIRFQKKASTPDACEDQLYTFDQHNNVTIPVGDGKEVVIYKEIRGEGASMEEKVICIIDEKRSRKSRNLLDAQSRGSEKRELEKRKPVSFRLGENSDVSYTITWIGGIK